MPLISIKSIKLLKVQALWQVNLTLWFIDISDSFVACCSEMPIRFAEVFEFFLGWIHNAKVHAGNY